MTPADSPYPDTRPATPKCFDCGAILDAEDGIVGDTYAFCDEYCLNAFKAGLGI